MGACTARKVYGENKDKDAAMIPAELAARRAALLAAAWEERPHTSQVQRRKYARFAPRAALMAVVVGCDFLQLEAHRLAQLLAGATSG